VYSIEILEKNGFTMTDRDDARHGKLSARVRSLRPMADRSAARASLPVERLVIWLVVVVAVVAITGTYVTHGQAWQRDTPDAEFAVAYDDATKTITVTHDGGAPIRDRGTTTLAVVVTDRSRDAATRIVWVADGTDGSATILGRDYPVTEGETVTVDDHTVDADGDGNVHDADASVGFPLNASDRVGVVWTGSLRDATDETVTLANATLE